MLRGPGCDGGGETTVLGHIRRAGLGGMGLKPPDACGVWMCAPCHDWVDGRRFTTPLDDERKSTYILDGLLRTLAALTKEGLI